MAELVVEFLFRPFIALIRIIGVLALEGALFQPIYWLGWAILKIISLGKLPSSKGDDWHWSEILCWVIGVVLIIMVGFGISYY